MRDAVLFGRFVSETMICIRWASLRGTNHPADLWLCYQKFSRAASDLLDDGHPVRKRTIDCDVAAPQIYALQLVTVDRCWVGSTAYGDRGARRVEVTLSTDSDRAWVKSA